MRSVPRCQPRSASRRRPVRSAGLLPRRLRRGRAARAAPSSRARASREAGRTQRHGRPSKRPGLRRTPQRCGARVHPAADPKAQRTAAGGEARHSDDHGCSRDSAGAHHREPRANAGASAWKDRTHQRKRREGRAVDQPQHHERECKRTNSGGASRVAAHDSDPGGVVEAAGQNDPDEGRASVASRQCERCRPFPPLEQTSPAQCLKCLGNQKQQPCRDEQTGIASREGPRTGCEVTGRQPRERDREDAVA